MNTQINLRLPENLITTAKTYAEKHEYSTLQEFIKETIREKMFEEPKISKAELALVRKLADVSIKKGLLGTEEELFKRLKK